MVKVTYSHRLLIDYDFVKWISTCSGRLKIDIIKWMLRTNKNSKDNTEEQIVILDEDFNKLCAEGIIKDNDIMRGCMFSCDLPSKLRKIAPLIDLGEFNKLPIEFRRLILGTLLTSKPPFQSIFMTTKESKLKHVSPSAYSTFLSRITKLQINNEEEAIIVLREFFTKYSMEHER